jgi:hypothetical protein
MQDERMQDAKARVEWGLFSMNAKNIPKREIYKATIRNLMLR